MNPITRYDGTYSTKAAEEYDWAVAICDIIQHSKCESYDGLVIINWLIAGSLCDGPLNTRA